MSVLDVIRSRREITSFQEKKVPKELLDQIVDAAYMHLRGIILLRENLFSLRTVKN